MQRLQQILIGETDLLQRRLLKIYLVVSVDPMAPSRFHSIFVATVMLVRWRLPNI